MATTSAEGWLRIPPELVSAWHDGWCETPKRWFTAGDADCYNKVDALFREAHRGVGRATTVDPMATTTQETSTEVTREPQADGSIKVTTTHATRTVTRTYVGQEGDYDESDCTTTNVDVQIENTPPPANRPPVLSVAASPSSGQAPLSVAFSSTGTMDPDGDAVTVKWVGDDGINVTAASFSHTYPTQDTYHVDVSATDARGGVASSTLTVTVTAPPPPTTHDTMFITGPNLFRVDGTRVIPKGVEQYFTSDTAPAPLPATITEMLRLKPSAVRILPNQPSNTTAVIVAAVKQISDAGCVVDLGMNGGTDVNAINILKTALAPYEKFMVIHVGESYATTAQAWGDASIVANRALRAAGWKCPIMHWSNNGGRNWATIKSQAERVFAADPLGNTGFGVQLYWTGDTYTDIDNTVDYYQALSGCSLRQAVDQIDAFPRYVQVGLCTDQPDTAPRKTPWRGLIDYIEASHPEVPWLWWGWNSSGPGTMTMNFIYAGPLSTDPVPPGRTVGTWNVGGGGQNDAKYVAEKVLVARKS